MRVIAVILLWLPIMLLAQTPVGRWDFDNPNDLCHATIGNNLVLVGSDWHENGPNDSNGSGATNINIGSYYRCNHGITANGGGAKVNEYTLIFDFMIPYDNNDWHSFYQTNYLNTDDGDFWVATDGTIGIFAVGYSSFHTILNRWYRLAVAVDLGSSFNVFLDGSPILVGASQNIDQRFALYPNDPNKPLLLFADNNGEDGQLLVSMVSIYDFCLSSSQIASLGGVDNDLSLAAPVNLTISNLSGLTKLQWDQVPGATIYRIYKKDNINATGWGWPIATTHNPYYFVTSSDSRAFYRVTAE